MMTARELEVEATDELERCEICGKLTDTVYCAPSFDLAAPTVVVCEDCYVDPTLRSEK